MAFDPSKCNFRRLGTVSASMGANVPKGVTIRAYRDTKGSGTVKIRVMNRSDKDSKSTHVETFYLSNTGERL